MITLFVDKTKLQGPVAPVRWCVSRDYMEKLKEFGVDRPYLLFIVAQEKEYGSGEEKYTRFREVDRRVVPLGQAMEYFEFNSSGKHTIHAQLIWTGHRSKHPRKELHKDCCGSSGRLQIYLDEASGGLKNHSYNDRHKEFISSSIEVVVPEGHFAPEPSAWEKWWVNLWFEDKPKNQCFFRRRRLLAYSIQPFVVLPWAIGKGLFTSCYILLMILCGIRGIRYHAISHPFVYRGMWDAYDDGYDSSSKAVGTSIFTHDSLGQEMENPLFLLMPMVQIVLWGAIFGVAYFTGWGVLTIAGTIIGVVIFLVLMVWLSNVTGINLETFFPEETSKERDARRKRELEELYSSQYQDIVCSGDPKQPSLAALSSSRRTVYLRFKELKSRVCLPYGQ